MDNELRDKWHKVADLVQNDGRAFDITDLYHCIIPRALKVFEVRAYCHLYVDERVMTWQAADMLFFGFDHSNSGRPDRNQAAHVIRHYADTGEVDWNAPTEA